MLAMEVQTYLWAVKETVEILVIEVKLESRNAEVLVTIFASETLTNSSSPACSNRMSNPQVGSISKPPKSVSNPKIQKSHQLSSKQPSSCVHDTIRKAPPVCRAGRMENSYGDDISVDSLMRHVWGKVPDNETSPWGREFVAEHHPHAKQNYDKAIRALRTTFKEVHLPVVAQAWKADFCSNKEAEGETLRYIEEVCAPLDPFQFIISGVPMFLPPNPRFILKDVDDHFPPMVIAEFPPCMRSTLPISAENMEIDIEGSDTKELKINIDHPLTCSPQFYKLVDDISPISCPNSKTFAGRLHSPSKSGESSSPTDFADCKESPDSEQSGYSANTDSTSKIPRGKCSIEELYDRMIEISAANSKRTKLSSVRPIPPAMKVTHGLDRSDKDGKLAIAMEAMKLRSKFLVYGNLQKFMAQKNRSCHSVGIRMPAMTIY
ncbi:hypothetical protein R1flu_013646 [Riccia fluitans]|uniref:Uncharacterized protein n=1 Tax=Riccia fluitans TaxID=41844 RepID=A0ABD1YEL0_9MARC